MQLWLSLFVIIYGSSFTLTGSLLRTQTNFKLGIQKSYYRKANSGIDEENSKQDEKEDNIIRKYKKTETSSLTAKEDTLGDSDDPYQLKSVADLVNYDFEPNNNDDLYLITGNIESQDMLNSRKEAWIHHCQWLRRQTLSPVSSVSILFEYTRLSKDFMFPCGQIMGLKAKSYSDIDELLKTEPLIMNGGITDWDVFKMEILPFADRNDMYDPYVFIGIFDKSCVQKQQSQVNYHFLSNKTCVFGILREKNLGVSIKPSKPQPLYDDGHAQDDPLDNTKSYESISNFDGNEKGIFLVFNSKSNNEALQYISNDPFFKENMYKRKYLSPINVQDIDGLHLAIPRSFAEKLQLDQIHYMNPTDILVMEPNKLSKLTNDEYLRSNEQVLSEIKRAEINYNYTRIGMDDKYSEDIKSWNKEMALWQRLRIRSSQMRESFSSDGGIVTETEYASSMGSDE